MATIPPADASPPDAQSTSAPELRADMTTVEVVEYMQRFQLADGSKIFTNYTSGLERVVVAAQLFDHVKEVGVQPRARPIVGLPQPICAGSCSSASSDGGSSRRRNSAIHG